MKPPPAKPTALAPTIDEWLAELARCDSDKPDDAGMSVGEIASELQCSATTIRQRLAVMIKDGLIRTGWVRRKRIDGRTALVPVYRGIPHEPARKTRRPTN